MFFRFGTLWYVIKKGFSNIRKNITFSIASVITMTICILLFGIFYSVCINVNQMAKEIEEGVTVTVFMEKNLGDDTVKQIGEKIKKHKAVKSEEYISGEQAWEEYKNEYFDNKEELAEGFNDDNPLVNSGHYEIKLLDVSMQGELVEYIQKIDGVRQVNQSKKVADIFTDVNRVLIIFSASIIIILIIVSVFLIQNTINAGIAMRNVEISIMKSIGATNTLIQMPFIIEGIVIGFLGSVIPLIFFHKLYDAVMGYVESKFTALGGLLTLVPESSVFNILTPVALAMGIGIGLVGSIITLHHKVVKIK